MLHHKNFDLLKQLIPGRYADLQTVCVGEGTLTPESAAIILDRFQPRREDGEVANRKFRSSNFRRLLSVFADGGARITGEPLIFSDVGLQLDGRHRTQACVTSNVAVPVLVVMGVPEERFDLIDQGATRSTGDVFGALGKQNYSALAAAAGSLWGFMYSGALDRLNQSQKHTYRPATSDDLLRLLERNPALESSVAQVRQMRQACHLVGTQGTLCAAHYVLGQVDQALCTGVFEALDAPPSQMGRVSPALMPALQVRDGLEKRDKQEKTKNVRKAMALLVKAWNFIRAGQLEKKVSWAESERFPQISGLQYDENGRPNTAWLKAA